MGMKGEKDDLLYKKGSLIQWFDVKTKEGPRSMSLGDYDRYECNQVNSKLKKEFSQTEIENELRNRLFQQQLINSIIEEQQQWEKREKCVIKLKKGAQERTLNIKNKKGYSLLEIEATNIIEGNDFSQESIEKIQKMISNVLKKPSIRIDCYSAKIIAQYFKSINDFINLEMVSKKFIGIFERFHINPFSLDEKTRKFFPYLKTLHLYNASDMVFDDGIISKKCIWYNIDYKSYKKEIAKGNGCKSVCYTKDDRIAFGNEIPEKVKILGIWCFSGCKKLFSMSIPESITELRDHCFENCGNLSSITLPKTPRKIGNCCFNSCVMIKSIELPENLSKIEYRCFDSCINLSSIKIPNNTTYLGDYCFSSCKSLTSIEIPSTVTKLSEGCFFDCVYLSTIVIPNSVVEIGDLCFEGCFSLNRLEIPNSVTKLGNGCFFGCDSLRSLTYHHPLQSYEKLFQEIINKNQR